MNLERELKRFVRQIRPGLIGATSNPNVNLAQVIDELKSSPEYRAQLVEALQEFLITRDLTTALTETGLTLEAGVFTEIFKRLEYKMLPKPVENQDILSFLTRLLDSPSDAQWLSKIDQERFEEFLKLILPNHLRLVEPLSPQIFMSLEILSLRLAGLGFDPVVAGRMRARRDFQTAFMEVPRRIQALLDGQAEGTLPAVRESLRRCSAAVAWIRSRRNVEGASLALTYRLMKTQQVIHRMELLCDLIQALLEDWKPQPAMKLFFEIVMAEIQRFDLSRFLGQNVELLAYQITEHTGRAGEHYITRNRSEWIAMFKSSAMGGAIVAGLAVMKAVMSKMHLPPAPEALVYGSLYASGFLFIHFIGATMATKQPAMTANTLAGALDAAPGSREAMENLSEVIIRTIRSQMVAVLGNFLVAFPVAVLLCLPLAYFDFPVMSEGKAIDTLYAHHPWKSLTFIYAAMAGVCLFVSGLLAGFADNWFVFNNVGSRLKQSEVLRRWVGTENLDRTIHNIDHNLGFWVGNVSLGFFLGSVGVMGQISGLPIDIRHITFATATFGAAVASLKFQVALSLAIWVTIAIFITGLINLGVSFSLSLFVAVKSRHIRFAQTPQLLRMLGRKFKERPMEFFFPMKDPS